LQLEAKSLKQDKASLEQEKLQMQQEKERLQEEHVRLEKQLSVKFQAEYENKYEQQLQGELDSVKQEAKRDVQAKIDAVEKQYQLALADKDEEIAKQQTRVKQTQWEGEELESRYQQLLDTQRVTQQVTVSRLEEEKQALQLEAKSLKQDKASLEEEKLQVQQEKERLQEEHVRLEKQLSMKFQAEYENKYEQQLQGELDSVKQEARRDVQAKIDAIEKQYQLALADKDEEIVKQQTRVKQTQWEGEELESRYQQLLDTQRVKASFAVGGEVIETR